MWETPTSMCMDFTEAIIKKLWTLGASQAQLQIKQTNIISNNQLVFLLALLQPP